MNTLQVINQGRGSNADRSCCDTVHTVLRIGRRTTVQARMPQMVQTRQESRWKYPLDHFGENSAAPCVQRPGSTRDVKTSAKETEECLSDGQYSELRR